MRYTDIITQATVSIFCEEGPGVTGIFAEHMIDRENRRLIGCGFAAIPFDTEIREIYTNHIRVNDSEAFVPNFALQVRRLWAMLDLIPAKTRMSLKKIEYQDFLSVKFTQKEAIKTLQDAGFIGNHIGTYEHSAEVHFKF